MSIFLKGDQMIPILNDLGVHAAVYGNHDFGKRNTPSTVIMRRLELED